MPSTWKMVVVVLALSAVTALPAAESSSSVEAATPQYVVHEWGTFTSVQGSDGVLLEWRPLATSDLPEFVYDRSKPDQWHIAQNAGRLPKSGYYVTERMETPVLYFYPKDEMVVDVAVKFPQGTITEWYPMARGIGPEKPDDPLNPTNGFVKWGKVRLFPAKQYPEFAKDIPEAKGGSNYFAARETESAYVRVGSPETGMFDHEKFLFYRGVGNFHAPLEVTGGAEAGLTIKNLDSDAIPMYFVLTVGDGTANYSAGHELKPGTATQQSRSGQAKNGTPDEIAAALSRDLAGALVKSGLYDAEAAAMVKTWRESWFLEKGTRVLYILPESWTNRTLPLTLTPAPTELKRVMVGRAELITAEMEQEIAKEIAALGVADFEAREKATKALQRFGRFAEPALRRVIKISTDQEVKARTQKLIDELRGAVK